MKATNTRKAWKMEDLQQMFNSRKNGVSVKQIAKDLGRTAPGIYGQLNIADFTSSETDDTRSHTTFKNHKRNIKAAMSCSEAA